MKRKQRLRGLVPCTSHPADLSPLESYTKPTVLDFGFKLEQQIGDVVESSIFHFRQMAKVKPAAVRKGDPSSHLGYMIVMHFFGIRQSSLKSFHLVQSAVAHLLTGASKTERITPTLAFLHWLPVHIRLHFKIIVLYLFANLYIVSTHLTSLSSSTPTHLPDASGLRTRCCWRCRWLDATSERIEPFLLPLLSPGITCH